MKKLQILVVIVTVIVSMTLVSCSLEEKDEKPNEQQPAGGLAILLNSIIGESGISFVNFTWNIFTDTWYENGWWHTSFDFELSNGDSGTLGLEANFKDSAGVDQIFPNDLTVRMEANVDFTGHLLSYPTTLESYILITRKPRSDVLWATASGTVYFDTVYLDFSTTQLRFDLNVVYPEGQVTAHFEDTWLGIWDCRLDFNGTPLVSIELTNGVETFVYTVNLETGEFK